MQEFFRVGVITKPQGLKGEVRIYPTTDDPKRFSYLEEVLVDMGREREILKIAHVRYYKQLVIASFEGKERIEDIEKYLKKDLLVSRENAIPLEEGEYYVADLIGLKVVDEEGQELGVLEDVLQTGANDVYMVRRAGAASDKDQLLIPSVPQFVKKVDLENGTVTCHLIPGM